MESNKHLIEKDKKRIAILLEKYVNIIVKEYKEYIPKYYLDYINEIRDFSSIVQISKSGTISLFVKNGILHLPIEAYYIIDELSRNKNYGKNKDHNTHNYEDIIINNNTFNDFVNHIILTGSTTVEYFEEILLHEAFHICGGKGHYGIQEGINELKARELAQKHHFKISACGYPKEVEVAYKIQSIFSKEIMNKIEFMDNEQIYLYLYNNLGQEKAELYKNIFFAMEKQFSKYIETSYLTIEDKIKAYDSIDYNEVYELINNFENKKIIRK